MSRMCGACGEPCGTQHDCEACGTPLHTTVVCEKVWMPREGMYFCDKGCLVAYNKKKLEEYESWKAMLPQESEAEGTAAEVIEVRSRPGAPIEAPSPQGYTVRKHTQFTEGDGTRGFKPGIADSMGRPGPTSPAGRDNDGDERRANGSGATKRRATNSPPKETRARRWTLCAP